ncbi:hypothetical protein L1F30_05320 [Simiduia sp. 21SJ11W-1]|uniref:hypothetical protein n=1 Tax=Simiduia sp. 21SJ11W-1 TaxID=2909669 RepID=UPI0020A100C7|nr:hypothetical protein [Simiduia sp. 21SJ11W-1]UTA48966.1 hypothetical protein L1F30_05320 [Simiduia sp. 21SJ11W-1]
MAWVLLLLSGWPWAAALGVEFGIIFAIFLVPVCVWLLLAPQWRANKNTHYRLKLRTPRQAAINHGAANQATGKPVELLNTPSARAPQASRGWQLVLRALALLLFTALASTLVAVAVVQLLPVSHLARLIWALALQTLFWGGLAIWLCGAARLRTPVVWSASAAVCSSVFLWLIAL